MTPRTFLSSVCLAALGACTSNPVAKPESVRLDSADVRMAADVPASADVDVAALMATAAAVKSPRPAKPALSLAELKSCANRLIAANRHGETLQSAAIKLLADRQRLHETQRALRRDYQSLNGASKDSAFEYARREKDLSNTTDRHKLEVGLYSASLRHFKTTKSEYRRDCGYRPYRGMDLAALAEGERAEMKKGFLAFKLPRLQ